MTQHLEENSKQIKRNKKISGVILTGKRSTHNQFLQFAGVDNKALIKIDGKVMLQHVLDALNDCQYIQDIYLVASEDFEDMDYNSEKPVKIIPCGETIVDNLMASVRRSGDSESVVITTCDNPLFRGFMLDNFVQRCLAIDADFYYSVGKKSIINANYPEIARTYIQAKDDAYTGANVYYVNKKGFFANQEALAEIDSYRKTPWKYVKVLGWTPLLKFAFNRITIEDVEKRASEVIGCRFRLIPMPFPECGIDVDKPSDLVLVQKLMQKKRWQNAIVN